MFCFQDLGEIKYNVVNNRYLKEENVLGNGIFIFINSCFIGLFKLLFKVYFMLGINNMVLMFSMIFEFKFIFF